jgi:predicted transposase YbfD/YdcC
MGERSVAAQFAGLEDPRVERTKKHSLGAILLIALCAVICGADSWVEVEQFGRAKREWLATVVDLPHGIPSHDTFGRVFAALDPQQFAAGFRAWVQGVHQDTGTEVIGIDGKTLRRSHQRRAGLGPLHMVSAWASKSRLVLAQAAVPGKTNELGALPTVLAMLALQGCIVTIDAMGCQTAIAQRIVDAQADYVLALKGNQERVATDVAALFTDAQAMDFRGIAHDRHRTREKDHGRVEVRETWVISDPAHLHYVDPDGHWAGLRSLVMVQATTHSAAGVSTETRYYLSSLAGSARQIQDAVRSHWGIENGLHWILDLAFREDECRVRTGHAAHNFAILRHAALNLLRHETSLRCGVKAKRMRAGWDTAYLLKVVASI